MVSARHERRLRIVSGHNCGVDPSAWKDSELRKDCPACNDPVYVAQLKREARDHEAAELKLRRVVGYCIESRKEPKELQAPWLRDMILSDIDPLMNITQQLRRPRMPKKPASERSRYRGNETSENVRDIPLRVVIVDGMLAIEIGLDTLKCVVENGPISHDFRLLDIDKLARELCIILANDEDEIGMTPVMHAIDNAIEQAVGDGSEAVAEISREEREEEDAEETRAIDREVGGRFEP